MGIRIYTDSKGTKPFDKWLSKFRYSRVRATTRAQLERLRIGNFGDCKSVRDGVLEFRIDLGPAYRVYLSRQGTVLVLLLARSGTSNGTGASLVTKEVELLYWKDIKDSSDV